MEIVNEMEGADQGQPTGSTTGKGRPFGEQAIRILQAANLAGADQNDDNLDPAELCTATFAGGCFWGLELAFQRAPGVHSTAVGFMGGFADEPTYREVKLGVTGHLEVVQLSYDPQTIAYVDLLHLFWDRHDPFSSRRQGNDVGPQYKPAIFYHTAEQKAEAEAYIANRQRKHIETIVTAVLPAEKFWPADERHQQYLQKKGQSADKGELSTIRCYG